MDCGALTEEMCKMHMEHMREFYRLGAMSGSQGESGVLLCLHMEKKPMLAGEFVSRLGLTTGRIANILKRLEEKGLVERRADREDGRHVVVALTDEGRRQAAESYRELRETHRDVMTYLGPEDGRNWLRLLKRLLEYEAAK